MDRLKMIEALQDADDVWDIVIIGGGATGLGSALDAASRGYKTLLLEQSDFAKGTSSRSTKLVHGGVRYLEQGNIALVMEALKERGLLKENASHLVSTQDFIIPNFKWWEKSFYLIGLKVYDLLAGKLSFGATRSLSKDEVLQYIPTIEPKNLKGGILYYDAQFDDSRLAINLAQSCIDADGTAINYVKVTGLLKSDGKVYGVKAKDLETGKIYEIKSKVVINATGVFVDEVLRMDNPKADKLVLTSQGVHLILDKKFLPGDCALMIPKTDDGRVLFAVPWNGKVLIGTTDTAVAGASLEPIALEEEIEFLLKHAAQYLTKDPTRKDVLSVFVGLRPLVRQKKIMDTAKISRSHTLTVARSGLVTITGGKWTTYRKMAEDTIDKAARIARLEKRDCKTKKLRIYGWMENINENETLHNYGSDAQSIRKIIAKNPELGQKLHNDLHYIKAEVVWAIVNEMARTVEDVLARRTRALFLNARASIEMAPEVARFLSKNLGKDREWERKEVESFTRLAKNYILE